MVRGVARPRSAARVTASGRDGSCQRSLQCARHQAGRWIGYWLQWPVPAAAAPPPGRPRLPGVAYPDAQRASSRLSSLGSPRYKLRNNQLNAAARRCRMIRKQTDMRIRSVDSGYINGVGPWKNVSRRRIIRSSSTKSPPVSGPRVSTVLIPSHQPPPRNPEFHHHATGSPQPA